MLASHSRLLPRTSDRRHAVGECWQEAAGCQCTLATHIRPPAWATDSRQASGALATCDRPQVCAGENSWPSSHTGDRWQAAGACQPQTVGCQHMPSTGGGLPARAHDRQLTNAVHRELAEGHRNVPVTDCRLPASAGELWQATSVCWPPAAVHQCVLVTGSRPLICTSNRWLNPAQAGNRRQSTGASQGQIAGHPCVQ